MDSDQLIALLNKFDDLRMERLPKAQEFVAQHDNTDELIADLANMLALIYVANQLRQQRLENARKVKGFKPDTAGFRSDTR